MAARAPREARFLGLWTAGWLAVLLVAGLLWVGNLALQWPVLLVPTGWALIAVRPRRRARSRRPGPSWRGEPPGWAGPPGPDRSRARRLPPTQELPWLPEVPPSSGARREE